MFQFILTRSLGQAPTSAKSESDWIHFCHTAAPQGDDWFHEHCLSPFVKTGKRSRFSLSPCPFPLLSTPGEFDLLIDHEPEHDHSGDEDYSAQRQRHRERAGEMRDEASHHRRESRANIAAEILNAGDRSDDFF